MGLCISQLNNQKVKLNQNKFLELLPIDLFIKLYIEILNLKFMMKEKIKKKLLLRGATRSPPPGWQSTTL